MFNRKAKAAAPAQPYGQKRIEFSGRVDGFDDLGYSVTDSAWALGKLDFGHEFNIVVLGKNYWLDHDDQQVGEFEFMINFESNRGRDEFDPGTLGYGEFSRDVCALITLNMEHVITRDLLMEFRHDPDRGVRLQGWTTAEKRFRIDWLGISGPGGGAGWGGPDGNGWVRESR